MCENKKEDINFMFETFLKINNVEDFKILFSDLCTYKEIDSMAQRMRAAQLLLQGETYEQIIKKTDISSATLSRISRCVKYGEGYKKFISTEE